MFLKFYFLWSGERDRIFLSANKNIVLNFFLVSVWFSTFNKTDLSKPNMRQKSRIKQRSTQKSEVLLFLEVNSYYCYYLLLFDDLCEIYLPKNLAICPRFFGGSMKLFSFFVPPDILSLKTLLSEPWWLIKSSSL